MDRRRSMYRAARDNTYIAYEEDHIQTRLGELMPITAWNDIVSASASRLQAATDTRQYDAFLTAYTDWMQLQEQQKAQQDRFQSEYGKSHSDMGSSSAIERITIFVHHLPLSYSVIWISENMMTNLPNGIYCASRRLLANIELFRRRIAVSTATTSAK